MKTISLLKPDPCESLVFSDNRISVKTRFLWKASFFKDLVPVKTDGSFGNRNPVKTRFLGTPGSCETDYREKPDLWSVLYIIMIIQ